MEPVAARELVPTDELPGARRRNGGDDRYDRCEGQDEMLDIATRDVTIESGILPSLTLFITPGYVAVRVPQVHFTHVDHKDICDHV